MQQFNLVVMNRILTPVQACIFLCDAWPSFCDCLAFTKALSLTGEAQDVSCHSAPQILETPESVDNVVRSHTELSCHLALYPTGITLK